MRTHTVLKALCLSLPLCAAPLMAQVPAGEDDYYELVTLPIPEGIVMEVGGMDILPDGQLAVATRRGEVWLI